MQVDQVRLTYASRWPMWFVFMDVSTLASVGSRRPDDVRAILPGSEAWIGAENTRRNVTRCWDTVGGLRPPIELCRGRREQSLAPRPRTSPTAIPFLTYSPSNQSLRTCATPELEKGIRIRNCTRISFLCLFSICDESRWGSFLPCGWQVLWLWPISGPRSKIGRG